MLQNLKTIAIASTIAFVVQSPAFSEDEYNVSKGVTAASAPLGLHGADPVALSKLNAVAEGDAEHTVVEDGVAYYFASEDSAREFRAAPDKYLPQFGGFCAFAVALGKKFDGDPQYADIVNGKLYLFVNDAIFQEYKKNPAKTIRNAERRWPQIRDKAVSEL